MINCEEFLKIADQFKLGELDTEKPHPDTMNLSDLAKDDFELKRREVIYF